MSVDRVDRDEATRSDELADFLTAARRLSKHLSLVLAEEGLREDQWRLMKLLNSRPGMLMGELTEALVMPAGTVTKLVDDLTDVGCVFRRPAPDDGRKASVYLSRTGHERLARAESVVETRQFDAPPTL